MKMDGGWVVCWPDGEEEEEDEEEEKVQVVVEC
jgi:hypothetical protein